MNQEGIRCGFFNSVNNDRKYDAEDMGRLFEGVISDGVFNTIEPKFKVEAVPETMDLLVNNGKAWFHERYFEIYDPITVSIRPTNIKPRIDAICICINTNDSVRAGSIEVIEGNTNKPSMPVEDGVYYIPIAWITIGPNDTVSTDLDIESNVGNATDPVKSYRCPYSEPSLDPRRAVYAYEGESDINPLANAQSGIMDIDLNEMTIEPAAPTSPNQGQMYITGYDTQTGQYWSEFDLPKPMESSNILFIAIPIAYIYKPDPSSPRTKYFINFGAREGRHSDCAFGDQLILPLTNQRMRIINWGIPYIDHVLSNHQSYYLKIKYLAIDLGEDQNE